jgi:3-hydroxymyristoyl/3-hydroxydecanoyl-(acyl carrier protein) dehydratase
MHYQCADRILEINAGAGTIVLVKTFPRTEDCFNGTFRQANEVPSSLVLETMASAGALLLAIRSQYRANALLLKVNRAMFPHPILAGAALTVRSSLTAAQGDWTGTADASQAVGMAQTLAQGFVGGKQAAEADLLFLCVPMVWLLGSRGDQILAHYLDLMGIADARPWEGRGSLPA